MHADMILYNTCTVIILGNTGTDIVRSTNYENINLYLNDFELTSNVADYITSNFGLNTFLHAV